MSWHLHVGREYRPPWSSIISSTNSIFEYKMSTLTGETEVEIIRINGINTLILLNIVIIISTMHYNLNICCTITIIGNISSTFSTIHSTTPSSPLFISCETTNLLEVGITINASTPAPVVCTYNTIFSIISLIQNDNKILIVGITNSVVGEVHYFGFLWSNINIVCKYSPPACRIILSTQEKWSGNDHGLCKCREFLHNAECLTCHDCLIGI